MLFRSETKVILFSDRGKYWIRSNLILSKRFILKVVGLYTNLYLLALASILVPSMKQSSKQKLYFKRMVLVIETKMASKCLTTTLLRNLEIVT